MYITDVHICADWEKGYEDTDKDMIKLQVDMPTLLAIEKLLQTKARDAVEHDKFDAARETLVSLQQIEEVIKEFWEVINAAGMGNG